MNKTLQEVNLQDVLNACLQKIPQENPVEYFDKMYASINPIAIMSAVDEAKILIKSESDKNKKSQSVENANVYLTLGGESLTQSFYTGVIAALMWLPQYIQESAQRFNVPQSSINTCLSVLNQCALPKIHDVKEEVINGTKVKVEPSNVRYYSAFLSSIVSWLNNGVTNFKVDGIMKTNMEMCRYLSSVALSSFPSVPFAAYYIGKCKTSNIFDFTQKIGKMFDFREYMTDECYTLNQPQFVVTTENAPIVSIVGHPLTETFIAEHKDNGDSKWLGLFVETEEFEKLCVENGLTTNKIKEYIISNTMESHLENLAKKDSVAMFIDSQKLTKEIFKLRQKFSSVCIDKNENYDV